MIVTLKEPKLVKARKEHTCDFCNKKISVGEEHTAATYKGDYVYDWRSCDRCKPYVREAFNSKNNDFSDGLNNQDFYDYMWEEHRNIAIEWWRD